MLMQAHTHHDKLTCLLVVLLYSCYNIFICLSCEALSSPSCKGVKYGEAGIW